MERLLTEWAVCRDQPDPYKPPEWSPLYLSGVCDGQPITTSHVAEVLAPRLYRTRSGSVYRLAGDPRPDYAEFCAKNGIALDLADPIKLID
jgi:hypothetical protein